jgi:hypothetical protein
LHLLLQGLRIVWMEGRRLLKLLNDFYLAATGDTQPPAAAAAAADGPRGAGTAAAQLSVVDGVAAATEVAAMLASFLQSFLDTAGANSSSSSGSGQLSQQQQQQQGVSCCVLLAENLVGPNGAVNYMGRVQQQACLNPGRQPATK